jgi:Uma2 family endonuclease
MAAPAVLRKPPRKMPLKTWTVLDLYRKFGPIAYERIRQDPPPGCGTVDDVDWLNNHEDRLYELVDGILVEKAAGFEESRIAMTIGRLIGNFVDPEGLGIVAGEAGTIQLDINLVRIPDVMFISLERLPGGEIPDEPIPLIVPDLAVEVISRSNTRKEMDDKLREYFEKGVRLVWYVRPRIRVVDVYTSPDRFTRLSASMRLDGGDVLPGFSVQVGELFAMPKRPGTGKVGNKDGPRPGKGNGRRSR